MDIDPPKSRKQEIQNSIEERNRQRVENLLARKATNSTDSAYYEDVVSFNQQFQNIISSIESTLLSTDFAISDIDGLIERLEEAKTLHSTSASFLPLFDIEQAQTKIQQTMDQIQSRKSSLTKKRFAFKASGQKGNPKQTQPSSMAQTPLTISEPIPDYKRTTQGRKNETIVIEPSMEDNRSDYNLLGLDNCRVYIIGITTALRLTRVSNSTIVCSPTNGSIFIDTCENSELHCAARQIRIHDSKNLSCCIFTQSKPTIENCTGMHFGQYLVSHERMTTWLQECSFDLEKNEWDHVQDFNWLKPNSPNWSKISEEKRTELPLMPF